MAVFDPQATPSTLLPADQVVLKLVPESRLVANVSIANSDIGFVKPAFQFLLESTLAPGEFGYIQGTLVSIGSDACRQTERIPLTDFQPQSNSQQTGEPGGNSLNLQSGMSVSANIRMFPPR